MTYSDHFIVYIWFVYLQCSSVKSSDYRFAVAVAVLKISTKQIYFCQCLHSIDVNLVAVNKIYLFEIRFLKFPITLYTNTVTAKSDSFVIVLIGHDVHCIWIWI